MAVDMTLKISGLDGESKVKDHEGEIDILSWSWHMTQSGSMHVGGGGGAGKVSIGDISITKQVDKATPNLIRACCKGKHFDEVVFTVRKAGDNPLDYLKITMEKVLVSSVDSGSGGEETPTENITLNFAKFEYAYTPQKDDGSGDAEITLNWNIEANTEE